MKKFFSFLILISFIEVVNAQVIHYVKSGATGGGTSWTDAGDLQTVINNANNGDQVWVAGGTYTAPLNGWFSMKEGVKIYGGFDGTENNLSARTSGAGNASILKGNGSNVIRNLGVITEAAVLNGFTIIDGSSSAGGMYNNNSSPTIINCIFSGNSGGGMENDNSSPVITNCIFSQNSTIGVGGGMSNYHASSPNITNCTFFGNSANAIGGGGINNVSPASPTITNCIFWYNRDNGGTEIHDIAGDQTINYSFTQQGGLSGTGNIIGSSDPFINSSNPAGADGILGTTDDGLVLAPGSLAINGGDPQTNNPGYVVQVGNADIVGNSRVLYNRVDMGAYEYQTLAKWYVKPNATGNGTSWNNAGDFQTIINNANESDSVFAAGGTYQPLSGQAFLMKEGVKIYGGFSGSETSLSQRNLASGNNSILKGNGTRVILNNNNALTSSSVLDGFTITGGNVTNSTGLHGGGMYNDHVSPVISNCIFSENNADFDGGGIFNNSSSPQIVNCVFFENTGGPSGGAIYNDNASSPSITNCTLAKNSAVAGGGITNENSYPTITNCIIYGNGGSGIANTPMSQPMVTYSLVQGLSADIVNHNIDGSVDPEFVNSTNNDFHLQPGSPAINAGNNTALPTDITTDIEGSSRIADGTIDLGAYETQKALPITLVNFEAIKENNSVRLQWTTASEINSKEFKILHATDGINFIQIGRITGSGTTSQKTVYSFYDYHPADGINYYRLQQVDLDGRITESEIQTVKFSSINNNIKVYPNPVENIVQIEFGSGKYEHLELMDVNGKMLQRWELNPMDTQKELDLGNLPAGEYLIKLSNNNSRSIKRVVKE